MSSLVISVHKKTFVKSLSKVCSKLYENSFPKLNKKLSSDTLYVSKDDPCLQCVLHFIFICDLLIPLLFSLTRQNESSLQVLVPRSIAEMKINLY